MSKSVTITTVTLTTGTLTEIKAILRQIKEKYLVTTIMTGLYAPDDRYVRFDALREKIDNLLENCKEKPL